MAAASAPSPSEEAASAAALASPGPSLACLGDAELLDWLWHERPFKEFSVPPAVAEERQHSESVFEDLISKHEGCHEALFGLGRLCLLQQRYEEALAYLEDAVALFGSEALYLAWLAWALLLSNPTRGLMKKAGALSRATILCQDALRLAPHLALALRCLAYVALATPLVAGGGWQAALPHAAELAAVCPVAGLYLMARILLEDPSHAEVAARGLKGLVAEVPLESRAAERAAAALVQHCLCAAGNGDWWAHFDYTTSAGAAGGQPQEGRPCNAKVVATKLIALDALWQHLVHRMRHPDQAAELSLLAAAQLRQPCLAAWQRPVGLALKALAFQGCWDECWQLAATELAFCLSHEVLYQCARLAYFDGRAEAIEAYLPHLYHLASTAPEDTLPYVRYWLGLLHHKRGHSLLAGRALRAALPGLREVGPSAKAKLTRAEAVIAGVEKMQADVQRIYDLSNELLSPAWAEQRGGAALAEKGRKGKGKGQSYSKGGATRHSLGGLEAAAEAMIAMSGGRKPGGLMAEAYRSPWTLYSVWKGSHAAASVEAEDPYLGKLCRGRLALVRGNMQEAEMVLQAAVAEAPQRWEAHAELWMLHAKQGDYKRAVLDGRQLVQLAGTEQGAFGPHVTIDLASLLRGKVWACAGAQPPCPDSVAHLLLGKALRRCGLWEDAWQFLLTGERKAAGQAGYAFTYQRTKVAVLALQEAFTRPPREPPSAGRHATGTAAAATTGAAGAAGARFSPAGWPATATASSPSPPAVPASALVVVPPLELAAQDSAEASLQPSEVSGSDVGDPKADAKATEGDPSRIDGGGRGVEAAGDATALSVRLWLDRGWTQVQALLGEGLPSLAPEDCIRATRWRARLDGCAKAAENWQPAV